MALASFHLYKTPIYSMDSLQYMGNALLMEETDPVAIHARVYADVNSSMPSFARSHLLGVDSAMAWEANKSRQVRRDDPYRFAEFLPLFAIRPLYNQTLYLFSKTRLGLVRSTVFISSFSYFVMGIVLFLWMRRVVSDRAAALFSLLTMECAPLTTLGRETTSDALATLVAFLSLFFIFGRKNLPFGICLLLTSLFLRTDFIVLVGPVLLLCWIGGELELWKAVTFAVLAVSSVLAINHFAGDYGLRMLYYRNFVGTPTAPAEMIAQFSFSDYLSAVRSGMTKISDSFLVPFLLLSCLALVRRRSLIHRGDYQRLLGVTGVYTVLHFLILPNWEERWFGIFYLTAAIAAVASFATGAASTTSEPDQPHSRQIEELSIPA